MSTSEFRVEEFDNQQDGGPDAPQAQFRVTMRLFDNAGATIEEVIDWCRHPSDVAAHFSNYIAVR